MPRQKLIVCFLAVLTTLGLAMYLLLPAGSEMRLLGIVLMIFCLPFVLRHAIKHAPSLAPAPRATEPVPASSPREVNLTVEATFSRIVETRLMLVNNGILDLPCLLVLGSDGFTTRLWRTDNITGPWPSDDKLILNAEFLMPERALPQFPVGTMARVVMGKSAIGSVKVLRNHAEENPVLP